MIVVFRKYLGHSFTRNLVIFFALAAIFSAVVYFRYPYAYSIPNFYAEDGKIYVANIFQMGPINATFQLFNGYLVVGQYLVVHFAMLINELFGSGFVSLPKAIAVASYVFLGVISCLPWLLFKNKMGSTMSIIAGFLIALFPLGASDWTVIGTVGNLKFAFVYIAFLMILHRNRLVDEKYAYRKMFWIDAVLLICIMTNITTIALLPLACLPYIRKQLVLKPKYNFKTLFSESSTIGLINLMCLSVVYVSYVLLHGIPKMHGYLDGPINIAGVVNALYRGSLYGFLYPLQSTMTTVLSMLLMITALVAVWYLVRNKNDRLSVSAAIYSILIAVFGFVISRPGVTEYYGTPVTTGGPGQFFYGGTLILIFVSLYLISSKINGMNKRQKTALSAFFMLYLVWSVPFAGYREKSLQEYNRVPPISQARAVACTSPPPGNSVKIQIYPTQEWYMTIKKEVACDR